MRRQLLYAGVLATAALLGTAVARGETAAPAPSASVVDSDRDAARRKFSEASALAKREQWSAALSTYRDSFALYPHAMTLFNVGFCLGQMGDWLAALRVTTAALDRERVEADLSLRAERRQTAEAQLLAIRAQLAELQLAGAEVLAVTVDGALATTLGGANAAIYAPEGAPLPELAGYADSHFSEPPRSLFVLPGPQRVAVQTTRGWQTFDVSPRAGEQLPLELDVTPPALPAVPVARPPQPSAGAPRRPVADPRRRLDWRKTAGVSALALGGAGLGLAAAFGVVARNADAQLADACSPDLGCGREQQATVDRYRRSMTWVNVGLITGVVGVSAGVSILLLVPAPQTKTALSLAPGSITLTHSF
jgi:hypothetical protein